MDLFINQCEHCCSMYAEIDCGMAHQDPQLATDVNILPEAEGYW